MKQKAIVSASGRCLLAAALVLGIYHSLYGLVDRHYAIPLPFHYGEFALIAVYAVVVCAAAAVLLSDREARTNALATARGRQLWCLVPAALFFVVTFLSAALVERQRPGSFLYSIGCLTDTGIHVFVLFPLGLWFGVRSDRRLLNRLFALLTGIYLVLVLYGLFGIHFDRNALIGNVPVEIKYGRLWLGAVNPNDTGMFCVLMMAVGLYRILTGGRKTKLLHAFAMAAFYICLILTDSRGGLLAIAVGFGAFAGMYWWHRSEGERRFLRVLSALVACGMVAAVIFLGRYAVKMLPPLTALVMLLAAAALLRWCQKFVTSRLLVCIGAAAALAALVPGIFYGSAILQKLSYDPTRSGGSGRLELWWIVVELLRDNRAYFWHGCGPLYISEHIAPLYGTAYTTHNQLLEIALGYGLPAMLVFLTWLGSVAWQSWRITKRPWAAADLGEKFLPFILLILLANNMFENCLLFYRFVTGSVFFLVAGYVCSGVFSPDLSQRFEQNKK